MSSESERRKDSSSGSDPSQEPTTQQFRSDSAKESDDLENDESDDPDITDGLFAEMFYKQLPCYIFCS